MDVPREVKHEKSPFKLKMQISYVIKVFCVVFNHKKRKTGFPEVRTEIAPKHHQVVIKTQCGGVFWTQLEKTNRLMGKKSRKS